MRSLLALLIVTLALAALCCCEKDPKEPSGSLSTDSIKIKKEVANAFVKRKKRSSPYEWICLGLQPLLWEILRMGRSLRSFGLEHSKPHRRKKLWLGRREGKHLDWHLLLLSPNHLEHQGRDYPIC
ncbi:uncharacterized protein LOC128788176 isoform X1 [Vidua chalybeata]|uniref:uncharacterized protein LOC128788176 isoform X1 n=1 Tax=Vidua chalybeata TaxID=81927 RepID=UPI0023A8A88A|nr:uncharacterized protein LOC128788176 isoform X1 [Vidua chalybeata]